jgi:hypothetical protein
MTERFGRHGDVHPCADCGVPTSEATGSYWLASDELWARVVGDDSIVLCPRHFHDRAEQRGILVSWRAIEEAGPSERELDERLAEIYPQLSDEPRAVRRAPWWRRLLGAR